MSETTQKKEATNVKSMKFIKIAVYTAAILVLVGLATLGPYKLSGVFSSGFSSDVFIYPLMMLKKLIIPTLLIVLIIGALVVYGIKHEKLWFMIPIGIILLGFYWYSINNSVYKAYVKRYMTTEESEQNNK